MVVLSDLEHTFTASTTSGSWTDHWALYSQYSQLASHSLTHSLAALLHCIHRLHARLANFTNSGHNNTQASQHRHLAAAALRPRCDAPPKQQWQRQQQQHWRALLYFANHTPSRVSTLLWVLLYTKARQQTVVVAPSQQTCHKRALAIGRQKLSHCYRPVCSIYDDNLHSFIV